MSVLGRKVINLQVFHWFDDLGLSTPYLILWVYAEFLLNTGQKELLCPLYSLTITLFAKRGAVF